jgi:hypothetical protein
MENYKKMYEDLFQAFEQYKKESIKWSVEDIINYPHFTHTITKEQAQYALIHMIYNHDAEYGITWSDVSYNIELFGTEKSI